uniref:Myelin-associated oligodendrocyte basic protein n=1 Tax=Noccaea caerulescens TaxID=107243 RepID=A0A1J3F889_NOCCA
MLGFLIRPIIFFLFLLSCHLKLFYLLISQFLHFFISLILLGYLSVGSIIMASSCTLLELTPLKWNPPFSYTHRRHHRIALFCSKPQRKSNYVGLQIALNYKQSDGDVRSDSAPAQTWKNSIDQIAIQMKKTLDSLKKPAIAAVLLGLILFYDPSWALAASGGRIGGNAFSSQSRSRSSSSYSYSVPRTSEPRYSAPYQGVSPLGGGGLYVGPAVGFGYGFGGFSSLSVILVGFAAFVLVSGFLSDRSQDGLLTDTQKTTVLKLQVGLLGLGRTLQQDFNRLAESADTSTSEGLSYVLTEATLALLRHPDYCISCYSSVDVKRSIQDGEKRFNQLSIEERGKFDEETLVNVNSIKRQSSKLRTATGFSNEYIVVTILVAAEGIHKLPPINGTVDLKEALQKLGSIPRNKIMAVEVLWTPQDDKDALSERELLEDYPLLRPL